ncbi:cation:proton antiporter domain-containing protein [Pedobacter sp. NJ-S-72]
MHTNIFDHITKQFQLPFTNPVLIFSLLLFIILIAPILLGKIKIPGIVGFIIAGILIGPNGFNILKKNSAIELFATIGLLYIMFIAGIELDLAEFKKKKNIRVLYLGF